MSDREIEDAAKKGGMNSLKTLILNRRKKRSQRTTKLKQLNLLKDRSSGSLVKRGIISEFD